VRDITRELVERWSHPVSATSIETLRLFLLQLLEHDDRVPISRLSFEMLCAHSFWASLESTLTAEQVLTLFRVVDKECPSEAGKQFIYSLTTIPPSTGTEDAFHETYDTNITRIFKLILRGTTSIRNSNKGTSTALKQPGFGLLVKGHCLFRGEEKGPDTPGDPERELITTVGRWEYDPLPYILGLL
jgi:hypothetical protein